MNKTTWR